jgi:hypothetical protein
MNNKNKNKNNIISQFDRKMKLMELNKTPERRQFEEEYSCYIFSLRPPSVITPETKELTWTIDTWHKVKKGDYDNTTHIVNMIKLRARFNNASVYGVWLPNEFNTPGSDKIEEPEKFYDLIWKYKFNM